MRKDDLSEKLSERLKISPRRARIMLDAVIEQISKALLSGEKVILTGFGTLSIRRRKSRVGRDPRTGEEIKLPETAHVHFATGKLFRRQIKERVTC